MIEALEHPVVVILGPTGSGKSELAEAVAVALDGEIVSADSMQIYRGMDIGTAKVPDEARRVPYHLIDVAEPGEDFSAGRYRELAHAAFTDIRARGRVPILVGGTGLYIRAAIDAFEMVSDVDPAIRERWETHLRERGAQSLHQQLVKRDPESAALIHPNNARRVVRALEMYELGESYGDQTSGFADRESTVPAVMFGLAWDRADLYDRIDSRVDTMIEQGLLDEVRTLVESGALTGTAAQAIGYKELIDVLDGVRSIDDALDELKRSSRRYAKRQLTWFRADPRIHWLDAQSHDGAPRVIESLRDELLSLLESPELQAEG